MLKNMKNLLILAVLVLCGTTAFGQTKKFLWDTELCQFESVYDAKKYTEKQLKNTRKLFSIGGFNIDTDATVWKFEEISKLNVNALDEEYKRKTSELKTLDIVKTPYFEDLRQKTLKEMEQSYRAKRITIEAYKNPKVLAGYKFADVCVQKYAAPLINGGDDLLKIWLTVNEESRAKNGSPENVKMIFDEQMKSPDNLKFARVEVMSFGWWNCVNEFTEYVEHDGKAQTEFKKLFRRNRTIECDEP
jgi:hypothetical protein